MPEMDSLFDQFVNKIHRRDYTVPDTVTPLEYDEFLDVFGATEPPGVPPGASMDELMGRTTTVVQGVDLNSQEYSEDAKLVVRRIMQEMGMTVTQLVEEPERGVVVTSEEGWEAIFGDPRHETDAKIAILSALSHSGESFKMADLRYTAAPFYA
jgi:hypothetical protein